MKQITTTKATILFVEVPEDAVNIQLVPSLKKPNIIDCFNSTLVYTYAKDHQGYTHLDGIGVHLNGWTFLTLLKDAREEQAQSICHKAIYADRWIDYTMEESENQGPYIFDTAIESLHSLATSLGVKGNAAILIQNK